MRKFDHKALKRMRVEAGLSRSALTRLMLVKDWSAAEQSILQWERERMPALTTFLAICSEIGSPEVREAARVLIENFTREVEVPAVE